MRDRPDSGAWGLPGMGTELGSDRTSTSARSTNQQYLEALRRWRNEVARPAHAIELARSILGESDRETLLKALECLGVLVPRITVGVQQDQLRTDLRNLALHGDPDVSASARRLLHRFHAQSTRPPARRRHP